MNTYERMNKVIDYLERHLTEEVDYGVAADIACCPKNQFQRIFSYLTEMSLADYIRRRRLTLSAFELQRGDLKVIEIAQKYGYDSHASFTRAFKQHHGFSPVEARNPEAVYQVFPKLIFQVQDHTRMRGKSKVAILGNIDFLELPAARMIGVSVLNGGGENPVPALWARCFRERTFQELEQHSPVLDCWVGWMGEYNSESGTFTYLAGMLMPADSEVPRGLDYRDVPPCLVGKGYINGDFANGDVFAHAHELTIKGIIQEGYEPDYSRGWSAEAYPKELSFEAEEGTIHYLCPCKKANP